MTLRFQHAALLALPLTLALSVSACSDDTNTGGTDDDETESGSESTGDGDGDETGSDSNTTTTTTSESDTEDCPVGAEGCPCTNGGSCDAGLMCEDGLCVPATPGDGDGDPATGDGDGDDPSGDGDGDTGGDGDGDTGGDGDGDTGGDACQGDEFIEIDAVDAAEIVGWDPTMSNFGEGLILAWDEVTPDAYVSFDIDVPHLIFDTLMSQ